MNIFINQTAYELPEGSTVLHAVSCIAPARPFAVAVNLQFIPQSEHATHVLCAGDSVEIITPVTGG